MRRTSKYATLAVLNSTVGPAALAAADGIFTQEASATNSSMTLTFKKPSRAADRRARMVALRLKEFLQPKQA